MLKRILFAAAPLMLLAGTVVADDDLLTKLAASELNATSVESIDEVAEEEMGQADVDALLGNDEDMDQEEAVAACYRRYGSSYGYRTYHHSYYSPVYTTYRYTHHYTPVYRPVTYSYSYHTPIYTSYWGCW